jgi:hypothetical protein
LEISLSTQVCKLIIIQYIYTFVLTYFRGPAPAKVMAENHMGRKPLQQTIREENLYNKPYGEATPATNPIMSLTGG